MITSHRKMEKVFSLAWRGKVLVTLSVLLGTLLQKSVTVILHEGTTFPKMATQARLKYPKELNPLPLLHPGDWKTVIRAYTPVGESSEGEVGDVSLFWSLLYRIWCCLWSLCCFSCSTHCRYTSLDLHWKRGQLFTWYTRNKNICLAYAVGKINMKTENESQAVDEGLRIGKIRQ